MLRTGYIWKNVKGWWKWLKKYKCFESEWQNSGPWVCKSPADRWKTDVQKASGLPTLPLVGQRWYWPFAIRADTLPSSLSTESWTSRTSESYLTLIESETWRTHSCSHFTCLKGDLIFLVHLNYRNHTGTVGPLYRCVPIGLQYKN